MSVQGEMINESGTMTGGGGKPRAGRMCLGSAAPCRADDKASASELISAEKELAVTQRVCIIPKIPTDCVICSNSEQNPRQIPAPE